MDFYNLHINSQIRAISKRKVAFSRLFKISLSTPIFGLLGQPLTCWFRCEERRLLKKIPGFHEKTDTASAR